LRGPIDEARRDRRAKHLRNVERQVRDGETQHFDVWLVPLLDQDRQILGMSITFEDVTGSLELRDQLQRSNQDLETAYEELQSTNEELETTNEELQSTVEELETTNEELQSSNEELETMNEELQSSNAEQEAINHELMVRTEEIEQLNTYLHSIMRSLRLGVIVVGTDFDVQIWNEGSFELWGLRNDEVVGRSMLSLDIGLDVGALADPIRACLRTGESTVLVVPAVNRRGRTIECRVRLAPLLGQDDEQQGVVIVVEDEAASRRDDDE
jgi:two-component system CheB/CheR fusion protein